MPPLNQPPLKGDLAYGIGLGKDHGWVGHNGEIPGFNTYLFYHPELDATMAVEVNSDISSGKCPKDVPTMSGTAERTLRITSRPNLRSARRCAGQARAIAARIAYSKTRSVGGACKDLQIEKIRVLIREAGAEDPRDGCVDRVCACSSRGLV